VKRTIGVVVVSLGVVVATALPALSLFTLDYRPRAAAPGTIVVATTLGPALEQDPEGYELYLASSDRIAGAVTGEGPPRDPRLVPIGRLVRRSDGSGRIRFTVPEVPAGTYIVVAYCEACLTSGSTFTSASEFRVTGSALPRTGGVPIVIFATGPSLLAIGLLVLFCKRRRGNPAM
jgi:hypothetical protein